MGLGLFPACAGMNRYAKSGKMQPRTVPRMRGDEPWLVAWRQFSARCSPHARG